MTNQTSQPFGIKKIKHIFLERPTNYRSWADGEHESDHGTLNNFIFYKASEMSLAEYPERVGLLVDKYVSFINEKLPRYQKRVFPEDVIIKNINNFISNVQA